MCSNNAHVNQQLNTKPRTARGFEDLGLGIYQGDVRRPARVWCAAVLAAACCRTMLESTPPFPALPGTWPPPAAAPLGPRIPPAAASAAPRSPPAASLRAPRAASLCAPRSPRAARSRSAMLRLQREPEGGGGGGWHRRRNRDCEGKEDGVVLGPLR